MKIFKPYPQLILLAFLAVLGNSSHAQNPFGSLTTFENLYSRSDFIGWIRITDQHYEMIPYRREDGKKRNTIATINTFKVLDEIKRTPGTPNEFVSMGGEYPENHPLHGQTAYQTSEVYFQTGEEIFVHLGKNELLFDRLQVLGVTPGSRRGSVFLVDDSGPNFVMTPYYTVIDSQSRTDQAPSARITPDSYVLTLHRTRIDYARIKEVYKSLESGKAEGAQ